MQKTFTLELTNNFTSSLEYFTVFIDMSCTGGDEYSYEVYEIHDQVGDEFFLTSFSVKDQQKIDDAANELVDENSDELYQDHREALADRAQDYYDMER